MAHVGARSVQGEYGTENGGSAMRGDTGRRVRCLWKTRIGKVLSIRNLRAANALQFAVRRSANMGVLLAFFCAMMCLQLISVKFMVPETKGIPLEDLGQIHGPRNKRDTVGGYPEETGDNLNRRG
jgi:hypothetical protein